MPRFFLAIVLLNWNIGCEIHLVNGMRLVRLTFLPFTLFIRIGEPQK
ncbi:hypothetical protein CHCC20441_2431 [Bacillus licheniformis]|nr:hypothetical protein CHCC20441_2431 [Bacillus licheniformis]